MPASIHDHSTQGVAMAPCGTICDLEARPDPESPTSSNHGNTPVSGTSWDNDTGSVGAVPGSDSERLDDNGPGSTGLPDPGSSEETPKAWTWAFRKLRQTVAEAKGAATEEVIRFMMKHLRGTKLILVVGKAGTGKTTILSELTGLPGLVSGETLEQGTKEYHICPAIIDDEQYLFIDTAGFGDPKCDDSHKFQNIVSCVTALGAFVQVVGVLFVIGGVGTRLSQQDIKTARWLQCFCGPEFLRNVTIVTSFWDTYSSSAFRQAYDRMDSLYQDTTFNQLLHPSHPIERYHGATVYHHGVAGGELTPSSYPGLDFKEDREQRSEELRNLIRRRYADLKFKPVKLQFMKEVEHGIDPMETEAAKVLRADLIGTDVGIRAGKCFVRLDPELGNHLPMVHIPSPPEVDPKSWTERLYEWYELVQKLATYYQARRNATSTFSFVEEAWNGIRAWWSKPSNGW